MDVAWLPRQLPDNIKLIVSFKRGDPSAEKLYERFSEGKQFKLSEVPPFENVDDRRGLAQAYLSQYLKELDEEQLEALINLRGAENPLYLKVGLSELCVFGAYGNLTAKIRSDFGDNPVSAFVRVLERLEHDPAYSPIDPNRLCRCCSVCLFTHVAAPVVPGSISHLHGPRGRASVIISAAEAALSTNPYALQQNPWKCLENRAVAERVYRRE